MLTFSYYKDSKEEGNRESGKGGGEKKSGSSERGDLVERK